MTRILSCVLVLCLGVSGLLCAQVAALTKETMTITASVTMFDSATLDKQVGRCTGVTETASFRFWTTGDAPTSSVGKLVNAGSVIEIVGAASLRNFKAIRTGGTSATVSWECYGVR